MSDFNTANELSAALIWGRTYQGDEPCFKPTKIIFHRGLDSADKVVVERDDQTNWSAVANRIQALLRQGYDYTMLPCEYCGADELEDLLHCDGCGDPILHGEERAFTDASRESGTVCRRCDRDPASLEDVEL